MKTEELKDAAVHAAAASLGRILTPQERRVLETLYLRAFREGRASHPAQTRSVEEILRDRQAGAR